MRLFRINKFTRRLRIGLLSLALILPLAQSMAMIHSLSQHTQSENAHSVVRNAVHATYCSFCSSAQTMLGGAPLATTTQIVLTVSADPAPLFIEHSTEHAGMIRPYQSQAPPPVLS